VDRLKPTTMQSSTLPSRRRSSVRPKLYCGERPASPQIDLRQRRT
jgi:hypothetical protein